MDEYQMNFSQEEMELLRVAMRKLTYAIGDDICKCFSGVTTLDAVTAHCDSRREAMKLAARLDESNPTPTRKAKR